MGDLSPSLIPAELDDAVNALYGAVAAPETWADALEQLARATHSVGCLLYPRNQAPSLIQLPVPKDLREFIDAYVKGGWFQVDPRALCGWRAIDEGYVVITDDNFMTRDEWNNSRYFQDFHRLWKMPEWAAVAFKADGHQWCMPLLRDARQGPVPDEYKPQLAALSSHLGKAIELATMLDRRQKARQIEMLEQAGVTAALLDWRGTLIGLTSSAEALFDMDLTVKNGQLLIRDGEASRRMREVIAAQRAAQPLPSEFISVARGAGRRPVIIQIIALPKVLSDTFGRASLLLRFYDTETQAKTAGEVLRAAFGLTRAETRLVVELSQEHSTDLIAEKLCISKETARVQLKAAFRKTGTHKQSDLIALLANMPHSK